MNNFVTPKQSNKKSIKKVLDAFLNLHEYLLRNNYKGFEYDDLLESDLVKLLTFDNIFAKIAAVNISKYTGEKTRNFLKVKKQPSTKASGYISQAYLKYFQLTKDEKFAAYACRHFLWLLKVRSPRYQSSWGNHFDFASKTGIIPKFHPTVVWTSHISRSFDYAQETFGGSFYKIVVDSGNFIKNSIPVLQDDDGLCFSYTPGFENYGIHNANLLAAVCLIRAYKYSNDTEMLNLAKKAINWSCSKMASDGSWRYSERNRKRVDNYHTGYNLDCLLYAWRNHSEELVNWEVIEKTYNFWKNNFFNADCSPRFYPWSSYPYDIQATAQAIESMVKFSEFDPEAQNIAEGLCLWAIKNMQKSNGSFRYRIYPTWINDLEAIHWGQATMASALASYLHTYGYEKSA